MFNSDANVATVEHDVTGVEDLTSQLLSKRQDSKQAPETALDHKDTPSRTKEDKAPSNYKKTAFRKGEDVYEIDDDAEIEFMADKQSVKMRLADLKDRAAGDVAIKNRMHALAEEKKKVQGTLKEFGSIAKKDPLKALEYISKQVQEAGTDFEYDQYLNALAQQAEQLASMDETELRAHRAEKKLAEVEGDLSQKEKENFVRQRTRDSCEALGITESQFNQAAQMVLENPNLVEGLNSEEEFFETVEQVVVKAQHQRRVETAITRVDPSEATNTEFIMELAEVVEELLPDGTDADLQEIVEELMKPRVRNKVEARLSQKQRNSMPVEHMRAHGVSEFQLLVEQLKERKADKRR